MCVGISCKTFCSYHFSKVGGGETHEHVLCVLTCDIKPIVKLLISSEHITSTCANEDIFLVCI